MPDVDKMDFVKRCIEVVTKPSNFFKDKFTEELTQPAIHLVLVSVIAAIVGFILTLPFQALAGGMGLMGIILSPIFALIGWIIGGLISHLFVLLVGGKGGWKRTLKILAYAATINIPAAIPLVGIVFSLYAFYLISIGYQKQHNLTGMRAAIAILAPMVIVFLIALVFAAAIVAIVASLGLTGLGGLEGLQGYMS